MPEGLYPIFTAGFARMHVCTPKFSKIRNEFWYDFYNKLQDFFPKLYNYIVIYMKVIFEENTLSSIVFNHLHEHLVSFYKSAKIISKY